MAEDSGQKLLGNTRPEFLVCGFLFFAVVLIYVQTLGHSFVFYDDLDYVRNNVHVRRGLTFSSVLWAFQTTAESNWHPLTWLSHMLDCQFFGLNPGGHHLTNLLFHAANSILLFVLLKKMTGALWRSAVVAALFAVHPLHVESVAWVAERKDLLSTFFFLLTLLAYVSYTRRPDWKRYAAVFLLFALGLMAKPMIVTLPFVLLLLDYWPLDRIHPAESSRLSQYLPTIRRLITEKIPLFALSALSCAVTVYAQRPALQSFNDIALSTRIENALVSYVKYLGKTVFPEGLAVFYPYPAAIPEGVALLSAAILVFITIEVLRAAKARRYLPVGWFWFLGTLAPVIGIVQVGDQAMADRYTYIPLIGVFIVLAWGAEDIRSLLRVNVKKIGTATAAVLSLLAFLSFNQAGRWKNSVTLFEHTIRVTENNYLAHNNLAAALVVEGKLDRAAAHAAEALRTNPGFIDARLNLAVIAQEKGDTERAVELYREALGLKPNSKARIGFASALMAKGDFEEAGEQLLLALKDDPKNASAHNSYGLYLLFKGNPQGAVACFKKALLLDPNNAGARKNLDVTLKALGRRQGHGKDGNGNVEGVHD
ncbi:MAG: tetratricopeptide repeat protein [Syntrophobacterales bacterium]|nr:tetratricopeptide repeat protein [Syntrophobacterales bacterium]